MTVVLRPAAAVASSSGAWRVAECSKHAALLSHVGVSRPLQLGDEPACSAMTCNRNGVSPLSLMSSVCDALLGWLPSRLPGV